MSILALDVIDRLPFELAARLECDEFFSDIPVVVAEEGNVRATLERKQAVVTAKSGKRGVAVVVLQVIGDDPYAEVTFGPLALRPAFQVIENLDLNRDANGTGKSARRVARRIRDVIKSLALYGIATDFVPDRPCIEPVNFDESMGKAVRGYQVNFVTYESDTEVSSQVAVPYFAEFPDAAPKIQVLCATEAAEIWYSLDDSFPGPGREGSVLYGGPIEVPAGGMTIRAAGYKAGVIGSQVNRATITVSPGGDPVLPHTPDTPPA